MQEFTKAVLRAAMLNDPTLSASERTALSEFLKTGLISTTVVEGPLLLNATKAALALGISDEVFRRVRDQAHVRGISELCGVEVTPGNRMFQQVALIKFSKGEYGLDWPVQNRAHIVGFEAAGANNLEEKAG